MSRLNTVDRPAMDATTDCGANEKATTSHSTLGTISSAPPSHIRQALSAATPPRFGTRRPASSAGVPALSAEPYVSASFGAPPPACSVLCDNRQTTFDSVPQKQAATAHSTPHPTCGPSIVPITFSG